VCATTHPVSVQLRAQLADARNVSLKHLVSKLLAGGLMAGIILIWWPAHYPTTGIEALVARGILATLGFELMMLAFTAVEDRLLARLAPRSTRLQRLRERAAAAPRPARTGFVLAAGGAAFIVPVVALASTGTPPQPKAESAKAVRVVQPVRERVVRQVVVKRQVVHDQVVVAAPAASAPTTTSAASRTASAPQATTPQAASQRTAAPAERTQQQAKQQPTSTTPATSAPAAATTTPTAPATAAPAADASGAAAEPAPAPAP